MSRYNPPIRRAAPVRRVSPAQAAAHKAMTRAREAQQFKRARNQLLWMRELGEKSSVELEPHIDQDEFFDDQFERRAHEKDPTPGAQDGMAIVPAKRGPWTGNNQLGIQRHFAPDSNNRQTILKLDEWDFPKIWTLSLGLDYDFASYGSSGGLTGAFGILAEVEFGSGGVTQYVEIDWVQGTAIVLPMNALNVVASFSSVPTEAGLPALPDDLQLRANIVQGTLTQALPTRTAFADPNNLTIHIPPFAKSVSLISAAAVDRPFDFYNRVDLLSFDGTIGGNTVVRAQYCQFVEYLDVVNELVGQPVFFPIPERARFLTFTNLTGFDEVQVQFRIGV